MTREELTDAITARDDLTLVIRGHLVLEVLLNRLLSRSASAQLDELERLDFSEKVDVVVALGAIPSEARGAWRLINRLRNRFAHDLRAQLSQRDANDLLNAMPEELRRSIRESYSVLDARDARALKEPRAVVGNCIGWLATFASRGVVARGGEPMKGEWSVDE